jgi:hypothetical protein
MIYHTRIYLRQRSYGYQAPRASAQLSYSSADK